jgi:hypothetical protein
MGSPEPTLQLAALHPFLGVFNGMRYGLAASPGEVISCERLAIYGYFNLMAMASTLRAFPLTMEHVPNWRTRADQTT